MEVYREILPHSYLLILTDDHDATRLTPLLHALRRASRSGKPSVWVDCSQLPRLPFAALRVLARFYRRLRQRQVQLVLCHLGHEARQLMARLPTATCPPVVPSLLDAERYCQQPHQLRPELVPAL